MDELSISPQVITWGAAGAQHPPPADLGAQGARRRRGVVGSNAAFAGILGDDDTVPRDLWDPAVAIGGVHHASPWFKMVDFRALKWGF